jgi:hypothetical protein
MSTWRARLAVLRDDGADAECAAANSANSASRTAGETIGTTGTNGMGAIGGEDRGDHDAAERNAMSAFYAAPADPGAYQPADADPLRDGLLAMAHSDLTAQRPRRSGD